MKAEHVLGLTAGGCYLLTIATFWVLLSAATTLVQVYTPSPVVADAAESHQVVGADRP